MITTRTCDGPPEKPDFVGTFSANVDNAEGDNPLPRPTRRARKGPPRSGAWIYGSTNSDLTVALLLKWSIADRRAGSPCGSQIWAGIVPFHYLGVDSLDIGLL